MAMPESPLNANKREEDEEEPVGYSAGEDDRDRARSGTPGHYDLISNESITETPAERETRIKRESLSAVDVTSKIFYYLSFPLLIVLVVLLAVEYTKHNIDRREAAITVALFCTVCAFVLTTYLVYLHLSTYTNPVQQRWICRILIMVPIYSIDSCVALYKMKYSDAINVVRDSYEAYVVYCFFRLLMEYTGGEEVLLRYWAENKPELKHPPPFCCFKAVTLDRKSLLTAKICLVQFMIIKPLTAVVSLPFLLTEFHGHKVALAMDAIVFVSCSFGFTSLVYFFLATKEMIAQHKPLGKFAAIKAVVFLSFWQSVLLAILKHFNAIPSSHDFSSSEISNGMSDFLITIEMFLICFVHSKVFPDGPYFPLDGQRRLQWWKLRHLFSVADVREEVKGLVSPGTDVKPNYTYY